MAKAQDAERLEKHRLEALSDGVLAVAVTLLVLSFMDLGDDSNVSQSGAELMQRLLGMWGHFLAYTLSFVYIGTYWLIHHLIFHYVHSTNRPLIALNMLFLMTVALLPFPTDLLAEHLRHEIPLVVTLFAAAHIAVGGSLALMWWYVTRDRRLVSADLRPDIVRQMNLMVLLGPALQLGAMVLSFRDIRLSFLLFALIPVFYLLPTAFGRLWPPPH